VRGEASMSGRPAIVRKEKFDQNLLLNKDEPGICNALVLQWLSGNGMLGAMTLGKGRVVKQARKVHQRMNTEMFFEYGLNITDAEDVRLGQQIDPIEEDFVVSWIKVSRPTHFFVGYSGNLLGTDIGHATGLIKLTQDGTDYKCFDPNDAIYEFRADPIMLWQRLSIVKAPPKGYSSIQLYSCEPTLLMKSIQGHIRQS
jgi:hypothetical protein